MNEKGTEPMVPIPQKKYLPPKSTSEYLQHNSSCWWLCRQNRTTTPVANSGIAFKQKLVASINMHLTSNDTQSHHSNNRLNAVQDSESCKLLEYYHLLKTKHKEIWSNACSKEFVQSCQGQAQDDTPSTNTIVSISPHELPLERNLPIFKYVRILNHRRKTHTVLDLQWEETS